MINNNLHPLVSTEEKDNYYFNLIKNNEYPKVENIQNIPTRIKANKQSITSKTRAALKKLSAQDEPVCTPKKAITIPYMRRVKLYSEFTLKDYQNFENDKVLSTYGSSFFSFIKSIEMNQITPSLLERHSITPELRTKMIDWILEVYLAFNYSDSCFFLTIHILDMYIAKIDRELNDNDIHLTGIVSMFIASKFEESKSLRLDFLYEKIGYRNFSKEEIIQKEIEIVKVVGLENLICTSAGEFINSFCYDFLHNNKDFINKYDVKSLFKIMEMNALYFAKLITHFHKLNKFCASIKAVVCLIIAFDQIKNENVKLGENELFYIREWLKYIISECKLENSIQEIYNDATDAMEVYNSLDFIGFNLNIQYNQMKDELVASERHN